MLSLQFFVIHNFAGLCLSSHKDALCRSMGTLSTVKESKIFPVADFLHPIIKKLQIKPVAFAESV
jgi:hypothetical protein